MNNVNVCEKEKKFVKRLVIVTTLLVIISSIEAIIMAKSKELFDAYIIINKNHTFSDYISLVLVNYFSTIFEAIIITLFTFFTYNKYGISSLYKIFFSAIIFMKLVNYLLKFNTSSVFYFLTIILYIILLITLVTAPNRKGR